MPKNSFLKNCDLKNNFLIINGRLLKTTNCKKIIKLTINQSKLLFCLINGDIEKKVIIEKIWGVVKKDASEACYRKLVSRTRVLLSSNGFPENTIVTIPNYGLCVNNQFFNIKKISEPYYFTHQNTISSPGLYY